MNDASSLNRETLVKLVQHKEALLEQLRQEHASVLQENERLRDEVRQLDSTVQDQQQRIRTLEERLAGWKVGWNRQLARLCDALGAV